MKETFLPTAVRIAAKRIPLGLGCALALTFPHLNATAQDDVNLGTANNFAVLAGSAITVTTAANALPSTVNADIGSYPTPTVTGTSLVFLNGGVNETGDSGLMQTAKNDLATAYGFMHK